MNRATEILMDYYFWKSNPDATAITAVINAGADVTARTIDGLTPLHSAAEYGTAETITAIIAAGADIEATEIDGFTPLHWAARYGAAETVTALIDADADIEAITKNGDTPYDLAQNNHKLRGTEAMELLTK